jgi:hypothetical protein
VWVSPNLEYHELDLPANSHRKSWTKPHPDIVRYGHRDHANCVRRRLAAETVTAEAARMLPLHPTP